MGARGRLVVRGWLGVRWSGPWVPACAEMTRGGFCADGWVWRSLDSGLRRDDVETRDEGAPWSAGGVLRLRDERGRDGAGITGGKGGNDGSKDENDKGCFYCWVAWRRVRISWACSVRPWSSCSMAVRRIMSAL